MNDRMEDWLARLPSEPPASDLSARIVAAVAARRRAQARWRQVGVLAALGVGAGASLVAVSWTEAMSLLASQTALVGETGISQTLEAFLASPLDSISAWVQSILSLQSAMSEGIGAAFVLGIVLLAIAGFGGIARLLQASPPANGYSH